jgi:signal transduction histidine kinase/DNA-binding response OmpR family regulator
MKMLPGKNITCLFVFILCCASLVVPHESFASDRTLVLDRAEKSYFLGPYVDVLNDPEGSLTIEDLADPLPDLKFKFLGTRILNLGEVSQTVWLRFAIQIPWDKQNPGNWILNPGTLLPGLFTLYIPKPEPSGEKKWIIQTIGAPIIPTFIDRNSGKKPFFRLPDHLDRPTTLYIKIQSQKQVILSLKIVNETQNMSDWTKDISFFNLIYGALLALAIYHLCLYFVLRDISALYFIFYILFTCAFHYSLNNPTIFGLLDIEDITRHNRISMFFGAACLFWYTIFVRSFLQIKNYLPRMDKAVIGFACFSIILAVMSMWANLLILGPILDLMILCSTVFLCGIGFVIWKKGFAPAKFYLISTIFPTISVVYYTLFLENLVSYSSKMISFLDMSFALEGILLSLALADRIRILRSEREFAQGANLAKSQFLASMSHEIRTPMNAIMGMADLLRESPLNKEQKKYVQIFQNAGRSLLNLINDILDISKIEAGQIELRKNVFNIREVIEKACEILALNAHEKGLELLCRMRPDVPEFVNGDPIRLRQVVINLLGNAIKFTHQGEVTLEIKVQGVTEDGIQLLFSVTDTGIGIPKSRHENIFESFTQVDHSSTRSYGGTGLGLTISRQIVNMMNGKIWVESVEGKGSSFYFTINLKTAFQPVSKKIPRAQTLKGIHVLVVDDNATNRLILKEKLLSWGAVIKEVASGKQGIEAIEAAKNQGKPFELILLDSRMPEMDGIETARQIDGKNGYLKHTIIMLTSDERSRDISKAREVGIMAYLVKPVKHEDLRKTIQTALSEKIGTIPQPEQNSSKPTEVEIQPLKILVVEDAEENRFVIQAYLKSFPYKIEMAENGQIGLNKYMTQPFDIVLMDMQMPVMDGYIATQKIREWEKKQNKNQTPVIALTAHALREDRRKCLDAGCSEYLSKPIKKALLIKMLEYFTSR